MTYEIWQMGEDISQELLKRSWRLEVYNRGEELRRRYGCYQPDAWHLDVIAYTPDVHPWTVSVHAHRYKEKRILVNVDKIEEFPSDLTHTKLMLLSGR
jgi:hypothetical protein